MDAICAYQSVEGTGGDPQSLLIYTSDNTLFEIIENPDGIIGTLDSFFEIKN